MHLGTCRDIFLDTLHLAILAFSTTVFLQGEGVRVRYHNLSRRLHASISRLGTFDKAPQIWHWILFVTAISAVTDEDDYWLMPLIKTALRKTGLTTWKSVRDVLKSFIWIDPLHDSEGKKVFDKVSLVEISVTKPTEPSTQVRLMPSKF